MGRTTLEHFIQNCLLWQGLHVGARGGRSNKDSMWQTDHSPHFSSSCATVFEKIGTEVDPGKDGGVGKKVV